MVLAQVAKHLLFGTHDSLIEFVLVLLDHHCKQLFAGFGVLGDLLVCRGICDSQPGVHMPLVGEDTHRYVDLGVFNSTGPFWRLPGVLVAVVPRNTHT